MSLAGIRVDCTALIEREFGYKGRQGERIVAVEIAKIFIFCRVHSLLLLPLGCARFSTGLV